MRTHKQFRKVVRLKSLFSAYLALYQLVLARFIFPREGEERLTQEKSTEA